MKNSTFDIKINKKTGAISSIKNPNDLHKMNWCTDEEKWGRIFAGDFGYGKLPGGKYTTIVLKQGIELKSCVSDDTRCESEYLGEKVSVKVTREFSSKGNLIETYIIKNITDTVITLNRDTFGIAVPFNDRYTSADECMVRHCHTHIWCGHNVAWVNALRMGVSDCNLGLVLTKGALDCYSQIKTKTNIRGVFILHPESVLLKSGEEYTLRWELFWHKGTEDFLNILNEYNNIKVTAQHFTVFKNENIEFEVNAANGKKVEVFLDDELIPSSYQNSATKVSYKPKRLGEHRFVIKQNNRVTLADFNVKEEFEKLLLKRLKFIIKKQQCLDKSSPLYGAFLIYDNESEGTYFDDIVHDHNACRERMNIPLLLLKFLQIRNDEEIRRAMDLYIDFLFREFYEETTGEVFNSIGKRRNLIRPYNAPGVMLVLCETYFVTKDKKYLKNIMKLAEHYYGIGGEKCYSNAVAVAKVMRAFKEAGMTKEAEKMLSLFKKHADNIIKNGTDYPKHEVNYEQTIVTPAVSIVAEYGLVSGDNRCYGEAKKHMACLERFSGFQPSYHLNEIAIRFWDDVWFGKSRLFGDTLPHHLSCLTARAYYNYYKVSGEEIWLKKAEECVRNCMCLISDDGRGYAAYIYPYKCRGEKGEFYDSFANDQDLVFYDALYLSENVDAFKI